MNGNALPASPREPASRTVGWWAMLRTAALLLASTLSPAAWGRPARHAVATEVYLHARSTLPRFALVSGLFSLVLVHIVVVTAQSYGLTQFALGTVIRVLVVELLPLAAALFVAVQGTPDAAPALDGEATADEAGSIGLPTALLARVAARYVAVVALTTTAGGIALVLAYLGVYGFTPWGVASFTRTVGQVFDPIVLMALGLKTGLFAAAVAAIPPACDTDGGAGDPTLHGTVRLFAVLIAIETLSLAVEFF
ncbi:MAG: ABC transporter permease [Azospira sp.]|jgi:phospholipid/cholesterol/gamma-HCH transport system permease protein|nr:ABC transporter permease [Azospira sp.]